MKQKYKARSVIPIRSQADIDPKNVIGNVPKGEIVTVTSVIEKDKLVFGKVKKGLYVILERDGVLNFEPV